MYWRGRFRRMTSSGGAWMTARATSVGPPRAMRPPSGSVHNLVSRNQSIARPRVGDRAVVTMPLGGQLSVRQLPGTDAVLVQRADNGTQFSVIAGPQTVDGYNWYQIRSDDGSIEGWAADGDGEDRWLSPLE